MPASEQSGKAHSEQGPNDKQLPPLSGRWLEPLAEPDRGAVVALPLGAVGPRRIVVGVHGAGDRPEWSCGGWRLAANASSFVLCPRGTKQDAQRFAWASSRSIEQALDTALVELRRRYGPYLDESHGIYAGFSQGASLAEPILRARAREFPIAILAEGGYVSARSPDFARTYRAQGGRRVVLVCGSRPCFLNAARAQPILENAGLEVLVVGDESAGHNLNARMQVALQRAWPAIVAAPR
jgi:predicted esterase